MTIFTQTTTAKQIEIDRIDPNPQQPRRNFDKSKLGELALSITRNGIIQPIVVEGTRDGRYIIHDGERRLRAAKLAGLDEIPAVVVGIPGGTDEKTRLLRATVANVQRDDLNAIETARAYQALADQGMSDQQIADAVGKSRSKIANSRRLLKLPDDMLTAIETGQVSERAGLAYLPALDIKPHLMDGAGLTNQVDFLVWDIPTPNALKKRILRDGLTSKEIREIVNKIKDRVTPMPCAKCEQDIKKIRGGHVNDGDKIYCVKCWESMVVHRYCPGCLAWNTVKLSAIETGDEHECRSCHQATPADTWLTEKPKPEQTDSPETTDEAALPSPEVERLDAQAELDEKGTIGDAVAALKPESRPEQSEPLPGGELKRLDAQQRAELDELKNASTDYIADILKNNHTYALKFLLLGIAPEYYQQKATFVEMQNRDEIARLIATKIAEHYSHYNPPPDDYAHAINNHLSYIADALHFSIETETVIREQTVEAT